MSSAGVEAAYGIRSPTTPDADMPKGSVDKNAAGTLFAHLADIRHGWTAASLSLEERQGPSSCGTARTFPTTSPESSRA